MCLLSLPQLCHPHPHPHMFFEQMGSLIQIILSAALPPTSSDTPQPGLPVRPSTILHGQSPYYCHYHADCSLHSGLFHQQQVPTLVVPVFHTAMVPSLTTPMVSSWVALPILLPPLLMGPLFTTVHHHSLLVIRVHHSSLLTTTRHQSLSLIIFYHAHYQLPLLTITHHHPLFITV